MTQKEIEQYYITSSDPNDLSHAFKMLKSEDKEIRRLGISIIKHSNFYHWVLEERYDTMDYYNVAAYLDTCIEYPTCLYCSMPVRYVYERKYKTALNS